MVRIFGSLILSLSTCLAASKEDLNLVFMSSAMGPLASAGMVMNEAVRMMTEEVNNNLNLLPDYNLKAGLIMHMFGSKPKLTQRPPRG